MVPLLGFCFRSWRAVSFRTAAWTSLGVALLVGQGCGSKSFKSIEEAGDSSSFSTAGASSAPSTSAASSSETASSDMSSFASSTADTVSSEPASTDTTTNPSSTSDNVSSQPDALELDGAPLVFAPTPSSFSVSVVTRAGDPSHLTLAVRRSGNEEWGEPLDATIRAADLGEWTVSDLEPNSLYEYEVAAREGDDAGATRVLFSGKARTARPAGETFRFAMVSDTHIGSDLSYSNQGDELVYAAICAEIEQEDPDFLINLGDLLDYHQFGFNQPPPTAEISRAAYMNYRNAMGNLAGKVAHFSVVGNWDGENGEFTTEQIMRSRDTRMLYVPNPNPQTYPEGGSPAQDYYAFTWGDALFVVLNVQTYTTTPHLLIGEGESAEDWTLGSEQLAWLRKTLTESKAKWKFTFIHHTVGGNAGNLANSTYGRGGGRAAYVGEQAEIHQLMLDTKSTIFFHGHDHVFVDMIVDGLHYSDPGSAGAPWKFEQAETGYEVYWTESGWSRVNVSPDRVHVEFIAAGGTVLHQYFVPELNSVQ